MSGRLFIWNANAACERPFDNNERGTWIYPWTVSADRPERLDDFIDMFETLPEAHSFAMAYAATEVAK